MRVNDAIFVPGRSCPACGSALRWLPGRTRINVPSVTRDSFWAHAERRVVGHSGREAKTQVVWVVTADAICPSCNRVMDHRDGREGYAPTPAEAPAGYWLPDESGVSGGCQPGGGGGGVADSPPPQVGAGGDGPGGSAPRT